MLPVIVVDAHPIIRSGIQELLRQHASIQFAGGAVSIPEAFPLLHNMETGAIIVNLPPPITSGLDQLLQLRKAFPKIGIVVFSALEELVYAESCFRCGANAFVSKRAPVETIVIALEKAARGDMYCSDELKAQLIKRAATSQPAHGVSPTDTLSHAESQVFELMGEGKTTGQIAKVLQISTKTVETYRTRMKQKLGFRSGPQLTHFAITQTLGQKLSPAKAMSDE